MHPTILKGVTRYCREVASPYQWGQWVRYNSFLPIVDEQQLASFESDLGECGLANIDWSQWAVPAICGQFQGNQSYSELRIEDLIGWDQDFTRDDGEMPGRILEINEEFWGTINGCPKNGRPDWEGREDKGGFLEANQFESENVGDCWGGWERL